MPKRISEEEDNYNNSKLGISAAYIDSKQTIAAENSCCYSEGNCG
jgi:hypothetical protein